MKEATVTDVAGASIDRSRIAVFTWRRYLFRRRRTEDKQNTVLLISET